MDIYISHVMMIAWISLDNAHDHEQQIWVPKLVLIPGTTRMINPGLGSCRMLRGRCPDCQARLLPAHRKPNLYCCRTYDEVIEWGLKADPDGWLDIDEVRGGETRMITMRPCGRCRRRKVSDGTVMYMCVITIAWGL